MEQSLKHVLFIVEHQPGEDKMMELIIVRNSANHRLQKAVKYHAGSRIEQVLQTFCCKQSVNNAVWDATVHVILFF